MIVATIVAMITRPARQFLRTLAVSAMSNSRQRSLHTQIRKHLRISLPNRQQVVARTAIVGDGLAIGAGVAAVMAAEAARRIVVPKIIRVRSPGDAHVREDVAKV